MVFIAWRSYPSRCCSNSIFSYNTAVRFFWLVCESVRVGEFVWCRGIYFDWSGSIPTESAPCGMMVGAVSGFLLLWAIFSLFREEVVGKYRAELMVF